MLNRIHSDHQRALQSKLAEKIIGLVLVGCIFLMLWGWLVVL